MFVSICVFKVKEGKDEEFIKLVQKNRPEVLKGPGAVAYILHRSKEDPSTFMIYEKYEHEKDFKYHVDHFGDAIASIGPLLKEPPGGGIYDEIN